MSSKPRVAFFDFAGCEGDQLQIINLEEKLLDVLAAVEVVSFREAMTEHSDQYDIAFVEGSCTRESDEERLRTIRQNAKIVVALGACATIGGVNSLKNAFSDMDEVKRIVYGEDGKHIETYPARGIDRVIPVDYYIHGCPIEKNEFLHVFKSLVLGIEPRIPNYPVCVECKRNGNVCVFERGGFCLGPVVRAGCDSRCINSGSHCWGCRGLVEEPNINAEKDVLAKYGLSVKDVLARFRLYNDYRFEEIEK